MRTYLTFHHVNDAAHVALLDDQTFGRILNRIHAIDDLTDLGHFQIFHEVIVEDRRLDELTRSIFIWKHVQRNLMRRFHYFELLKYTIGA